VSVESIENVESVAMATGTVGIEEERAAPGAARTARHRMQERWAADPRRLVQTALGLTWLLDGALQFQSFMYSRGFVQTLTASSAGQPAWLADSIRWAARRAQSDLTLFNTLFALTQVLIGLGLLTRRAAKPALAGSIVWAFVVWWFGEGFGMLFANTANPLTGAPGAVLLYAIVALAVWPTERPGGLLGVKGCRRAWGILWLGMAWLWLLAPNSTADATSAAVNSVSSGISLVGTIQAAAATATKGDGLAIAMVLSLTSAAIGLAVAVNWRARPFLALAIALNLAYWVLGEGLGGLFTGSATDPNAAPLFILLAILLYSLVPVPSGAAARTEPVPATLTTRPSWLRAARARPMP
jgi:hypothetical protein